MSDLIGSVDYVLKKMGRVVLRDFYTDAPHMSWLRNVGGFTGSCAIRNGQQFTRGRAYAIVHLSAADLLRTSDDKQAFINYVLGSASLAARGLGKLIEDHITGRDVRQTDFAHAKDEACRFGVGFAAQGFRQAKPADEFFYLGPGVPHIADDDGRRVRRCDAADHLEFRLRVWGNPVPPPEIPDHPGGHL